jgi:hypothetical protein
MDFSTSNEAKKAAGAFDHPTRDVDGYDITPKPRPTEKPYVSIPSSYQPRVGYK